MPDSRGRFLAFYQQKYLKFIREKLVSDRIKRGSETMYLTELLPAASSAKRPNTTHNGFVPSF
jgi:hypothetical protein